MRSAVVQWVRGPAGISTVVVVLVVGVVAWFGVFRPKACLITCVPRAGGTHSVPATQTGTPSSQPSTPVPTPSAQRPLDQLMPTDLDVGSDCRANPSAEPGVIGIVTAYKCTAPSSSKIHGGSIEAYQLTDKPSLDTSLAAINRYVSFAPHTPGVRNSCPPTSEHPGDLTWEIDKVARGQLECFVAKDDSCVYIWTDTADLTLFYAQADRSVGCAKLDDWWQNDSGDAD